MYILILSRGYPTENNKILGIFEMDQARALRELGHKVVFLSTDLRSIRRKRKWGYERKTIDGIEVYGMNIPLGRVPTFILDRVSSFAVNYLYKKAFEENAKPDIIHGHFTNQAYLGSLLKKKHHIPLVVTEHSSNINRENIRKDLLKKGNIAYNEADKLITVSPTLKDRIEEKFGVESIYIPNIVDIDTFSYKARKKDGTFRFVSTGHLISTKGGDVTIKAFHKAFKDKSHVSLKMFGEGSQREALEDLIEKLDMKDKIELMGQSSREDIAEEYKRSDVFVLASESETFGVAYIEALSSGLPVLATKCGGPEAFIDDRNGMFSAVGSVDSLAENMRYIYENVDKFNREEISKETREKFSPENIGQQIIDVYKDIL